MFLKCKIFLQLWWTVCQHIHTHTHTKYFKRDYSFNQIDTYYMSIAGSIHKYSELIN